MDKRKTDLSQEALEIYEDFKNIAGPFLRTYTVNNIKTVREGVYRNVRYKGTAQPVTMTAKGNVLYIGSRQPTREQRLVEMLRKTLHHVDDEKLYDEVLQLLEVA